MQLNPTNWLVSLAGFGYDWIITREWKRVLLASIPALLFVSVGGLILYGKNLNSNRLAAWYLELGEEEIKDWENAWTGGGSESSESEVDGVSGEASAGNAADSLDTSEAAESDENAPGDDEAQKISGYADLLFRRVQTLSPTDRSQFIIGVNLAQRGAISQGKEMLTKIAPDKGSGYAPAHAFLALILDQELRFRPSQELLDLLKRHISEATRWDRVPQEVLIRGARLYLADADRTPVPGIKAASYKAAVNLLEQAAEHDPAVHLQIFKLSKALVDAGNELYRRSLDLSFRKAKSHFEAKLTENEKDDKARIALAELYAGDGNFEEAERLLTVGAQIERTELIARGLSEIFRLKFRRTRIENPKQANILFLDMALRHDPTNPMVVQEIADIARVPGPKPNEEMIDTLNKFLAEGKATALTHAWISEAYLNRKRYEDALPHLEQVVTKLPTAAQYLNNLAFVISELYPDRLEEALGYARRAVAAASKKPNADYFDTLGIIHSRLGQSKEAIAAFETAIELNPRRKDFHENVAAEYEKLGNETMVENHRNVIAAIEQEEAAANDEAQATADVQDG